MSYETQFWLYFFTLNSLFFIPRYILEAKTSTFIPYKDLLEGPLKERIRFLINRYNYDIFRISFDILLLSTFLFFFKDYWLPSSFTSIVFIIVLLLWSYQLYYHIFESIYQLEPTFHSDRLMLKTGFQLFFTSLSIANFFILIGIILLFSFIYFLIQKMLLVAGLANWTITSTLLTSAFGLMGIYSLLTYKYKSYGKIVFPSPTQSLIRNIRQSLQTKRNLDQFDFKALASYNPYRDFQFKQRPNIYFLVVESYGRVLYDHPELKKDYTEYFKDFETKLHQNQWHTASHLSTSPISGGSSWISFTTLLFGLCIKDQGSYLTMLHNQYMQQYPNMMRHLRSKGYKTYRLVALDSFKGMKIPWDDYQSFYAIDEWVKFRDLNYKGKMYGFGPCPPDQYALNFTHQLMREKAESPYFLFFITQNSHSPFQSPEAIVEDWQALNVPFGEAQFSSSIFVQPKLEDYKKAIHYQLSNITDFIQKQGSKNDLFIIVGDHQPPIFPAPKDGWETPIHIISKNEKFVQGFQEYGFTPGLFATLDIPSLKHEAVYSMLMRELLRQYGTDNSNLPEYHAEGIKFA